VEIRQTPENILVTAAVPGFRPEEIEVSVRDRQLIITGKSEMSREKKEDADLLLSEWKSDRFFRRLTLPSPVREDKVEARLRDGVLELTLPKAAEHDATKVAVAAG
jgi:HSP20 family protein